MLTLRQLETVATEVIGAPVHLTEDQSAADVPGWDSLHNTLIALDLASALGIDLDGWDMGQFETFGALIEGVNRKLPRD